MARRIEARVTASRTVPGGAEHALELGRAGDKTRVPAILLLPKGASPAAAALLLHGYASRKEHMAEGVGRALLAEGIATLAIDLPMHGDRGDPVQAQAMRNPLELRRRWKEGLEECELALRHLASRPEIDAERLAIVGFSLGAFIAVAAAARDESVRAVVLAAGGDLPSRTPLAVIARRVADPIAAVRKLDGRPLLMVNGTNDQTVTADQAKRLYEAAGEPKELRWWNGGHDLPPGVVRDAGVWLRERLSASSKRVVKRKRGSG